MLRNPIQREVRPLMLIVSRPTIPGPFPGRVVGSVQDVDGSGQDHGDGGERDGRLQHHREFRPARQRHGVGGLNAVALVNDTYR